MAKTVFQKMVETGRRAHHIVIDEGLRQITQPSEIDAFLLESIKANREQLDQIHKGKVKVRQFFIGDVMKRSRGQANPKILEQQLESIFALYQASPAAETLSEGSQEPSYVAVLRRLLYPEVWKARDKATTTPSSAQPSEPAEPSTLSTNTGE